VLNRDGKYSTRKLLPPLLFGWIRVLGYLDFPPEYLSFPKSLVRVNCGPLRSMHDT